MKSLDLLAAALAAGVSVGATGQAATGQLGDPAPALEIAEWVKGGPVDQRLEGEEDLCRQVLGDVVSRRAGRAFRI